MSLWLTAIGHLFRRSPLVRRRDGAIRMRPDNTRNIATASARRYLQRRFCRAKPPPAQKAAEYGSTHGYRTVSHARTSEQFEKPGRQRPYSKEILQLHISQIFPATKVTIDATRKKLRTAGNGQVVTDRISQGRRKESTMLGEIV